MTSWTIPAVLSTWIARLQCLVERRLCDLFPLVFCGLLFTTERRRTCTSWFRAAGISREFRRAYRVVCLTGRQARPMGMSVLHDICNTLAVAELPRIKLALDDTPSQRYGPPGSRRVG